jgi:hypothetical protein
MRLSGLTLCFFVISIAFLLQSCNAIRLQDLAQSFLTGEKVYPDEIIGGYGGGYGEDYDGDYDGGYGCNEGGYGGYGT